jgi:magnesium-transporting ATPase (P-type)
VSCSYTIIYHSRIAQPLWYFCVGDHPKTAEAIARKINLMIGDTKETLSVKTGRPIETIYDDEISAVVVHGDDIDSLEGWQWDLSRPRVSLPLDVMLTLTSFSLRETRDCICADITPAQARNR